MASPSPNLPHVPFDHNNWLAFLYRSLYPKHGNRYKNTVTAEKTDTDQTDATDSVWSRDVARRLHRRAQGRIRLDRARSRYRFRRDVRAIRYVLDGTSHVRADVEGGGAQTPGNDDRGLLAYPEAEGLSRCHDRKR